MSIHYEICFLSDLLKKSRKNSHPDYLAVLAYIQNRLDHLGAANSAFNRQMKYLQWILPKSFILKLLYRLRYDALIGFCSEDNQPHQVYGMITFQKHPGRAMIGMFDIYITPERRHQGMSNHFERLSQLVYDLTQRFQKSGYSYLQCGNNATTRRLLSLYEKVGRRNHWNCKVDVETSRIYL